MWRLRSDTRRLALALCALFASACRGGPEVVLRTSNGDGVRVRVEIVNTPAARSQGLMYRRDLPADGGMLFVFPAEEVQRFWMKNTLIPLDMLFISGEKRVVGVVAEARPMSTEPRGVDAPSRYVLEVNGGWAAAHGIGVGTVVEFVNVPEEAK